MIYYLLLLLPNDPCFPPNQQPDLPSCHIVPSNYGPDTEIQMRSHVLRERGKASGQWAHTCLLIAARAGF